jgi:hypothetical protein
MHLTLGDFHANTAAAGGWKDPKHHLMLLKVLTSSTIYHRVIIYLASQTMA